MSPRLALIVMNVVKLASKKRDRKYVPKYSAICDTSPEERDLSKGGQ